MSDITKNIKALQEEVKQETIRSAAAARRTLMVYAALVIFVAAYSLFLTTTIRRDATPRTLSIIFLEKVRDSLPQLLDGVEGKMEQNATLLAGKTVKSIYHVIPQMAEMAKVQCDLLIQAQLDNIEETYMPKVRQEVQASMEKILAHKDIGKDKDLANVLTVQVVDELDREVGKILGREFFDRLDKLTANVKILRTKNVSTMTNKEYSERMMIIYWLFMTDHGQTGNSVAASLLSSTTEAFLDYYKLEKLRESLKKTAK